MKVKHTSYALHPATDLRSEVQAEVCKACHRALGFSRLDHER